MTSAAPARADRHSAERFFPCLDGTRAVAALMVVAFHVAGQVGINRMDSGLSDYTNQLGHLGVAIFFVLSGFLLYRPFASAHLSGRSFPAVGPFFRRRFLRIFPAYWLALAAYAFVFHYPSAHIDSVGQFLLVGGLVQTFYSYPDYLLGIPIAWTLTLEVTFYLSLPLLAWAARRASPGGTEPGSRLQGELVLVGGFYVLGVAFRWFALDRGIGISPLLPAWADWFALGMLLAVVSAWRANGGRLPRWITALANLPALCWLLGLELMWVVAQLDIPPGFATKTIGDHMARNLCFGLIGFLVVLPGVLGNQERGLVRGFLRSPPMRVLGEISYGIYLWHILVIYEVGRRIADGGAIGFWTLFVPTLLVTIAVAAMSWFLVERPILRAGSGARGRPQRREAPDLRTTVPTGSS